VEETNKEEALKKGAMALFGEKYGDKVRMVTMDPAYSIELCGGTHVHSTGELGFFKIINETAVGAGLRRMEALSGQAAENFMREQLTELEDVREKLKNPKNLVGSIDNLLLENTGLKKELEKAREKQLSLLKDELLRKKRDVKNINFIGEIVDVANEEGLKKLAFLLKNELNHFVIVLLADITGKASAVVMIDENIVSAKNIKAPKIVKEIIAPFIQGGGGGQPTLATAGGKNVSQFNDVIESVQSFLSGI
jgi:alanyl-tRNA synthetase